MVIDLSVLIYLSEHHRYISVYLSELIYLSEHNHILVREARTGIWRFCIAAPTDL